MLAAFSHRDALDGSVQLLLLSERCYLNSDSETMVAFNLPVMYDAHLHLQW